jgi:hypothetical protein
MSGRTGKMTAEELLACERQRFMLVRLKTGGLKIIAENSVEARYWEYSVVARSFSQSYLKRVARFN